MRQRWKEKEWLGVSCENLGESLMGSTNGRGEK